MVRTGNENQHNPFTASLFLMMISALLILYQSSMAHTGPIRIFAEVKYELAKENKSHEEKTPYYPKFLTSKKKKYSFLNKDLHYTIGGDECSSNSSCEDTDSSGWETGSRVGSETKSM